MGKQHTEQLDTTIAKHIASNNTNRRSVHVAA
jgi:hypothetical protein